MESGKEKKTHIENKKVGTKCVICTSERQHQRVLLVNDNIKRILACVVVPKRTDAHAWIFQNFKCLYGTGR